MIVESIGVFDSMTFSKCRRHAGAPGFSLDKRHSQLTNNQSSGFAFVRTQARLPGFLFACLLASLVTVVTAGEAQATRLPTPLRNSIKEIFPGAQLRLDGVIKTKENILFIPLIPHKLSGGKNDNVTLIGKYPQGNPFLFHFSDGWCFLRLQQSTTHSILTIPDATPAGLKEALQSYHLPEDLIVPDNMSVEESLSKAVGDLNITTVRRSDPAKDKPVSTTTAAPVQRMASLGLVTVSSPATGKVLILGSGLKVVAELPTDGTPDGMVCIGKKIYIADQSKHRILIVNLDKKEFEGQIDLPAGCGPKDIVAHPSGKMLYVSECATNTVAVLELDTKKVLLRTVVPAGPTKLEITPNGFMVLVLTSGGKLAFISTLNQKLIGSMDIGQMPSTVVIDKEGKRAYVTSRNTDSVIVVDLAHKLIVGKIKTGEGPTGMVMSFDEKRLFVANAKANSISVIDLATAQRIKDVQLPLEVEFPGDLLLIPGGRHIIVSSAATDTIGLLNIDTLAFERQEKLGYTTVNLLWTPL